ncbi:MAG: hypothetical protein ACOH2K_01730 [Burkholderiaceae bacterium]
MNTQQLKDTAQALVAGDKDMRTSEHKHAPTNTGKAWTAGRKQKWNKHN